MERETKRGKHRDRSKNHRRKSDFILPRNARTDMRSRRSQLTSLSLSLLLLFLPLPILCCYSPGLYVTHPLTLELKCSPPPPLLICSLHYSFITHLRSLCSASVSLFLFIPQLQADVSNVLPVRQPNFWHWVGVENHKKQGTIKSV